MVGEQGEGTSQRGEHLDVRVPQGIWLGSVKTLKAPDDGTIPYDEVPAARRVKQDPP